MRGTRGATPARVRAISPIVEAIVAPQAAAMISTRFQSPDSRSQSQKSASHIATQGRTCFTLRVSPLGDTTNLPYENGGRRVRPPSRGRGDCECLLLLALLDARLRPRQLDRLELLAARDVGLLLQLSGRQDRPLGDRHQGHG